MSERIVHPEFEPEWHTPEPIAVVPGSLLAAVLESVGIEPRLCMRVYFEPNHIEATVCLLDQNGSRYLKPNGEIATTVRHHPIDWST